MGTPVAKILRLQLSTQCALKEISILYNFAIEKVKKNILLQRFKNPLSKLCKKNSQLDVESELNHKQIEIMYMRQSFLHLALKFIDYF